MKVRSNLVALVVTASVLIIGCLSSGGVPSNPEVQVLEAIISYEAGEAAGTDAQYLFVGAEGRLARLLKALDLRKSAAVIEVRPLEDSELRGNLRCLTSTGETGRGVLLKSIRMETGVTAKVSGVRNVGLFGAQRGYYRIRRAQGVWRVQSFVASAWS